MGISGQIHVPAALLRGIRSPLPLNRRPVRPQGQSRRFTVDLYSLLGNNPKLLRLMYWATIPTALCTLHTSLNRKSLQTRIFFYRNQNNQSKIFFKKWHCRISMDIYTRSVNKVMKLIQYNSVLTFKLQIEFVPFKIVPLGGYTPPETLFPLFVPTLVVANRNRF